MWKIVGKTHAHTQADIDTHINAKTNTKTNLKTTIGQICCTAPHPVSSNIGCARSAPTPEETRHGTETTNPSQNAKLKHKFQEKT